MAAVAGLDVALGLPRTHVRAVRRSEGTLGPRDGILRPNVALSQVL